MGDKIRAVFHVLQADLTRVKGEHGMIPPGTPLEFGAYHFKLFFLVLVLASLGGIAARLRKDTKITILEVLSAALNSGLFGIIIFLLGWRFWGIEEVEFLIGFSALAGFGGTTLIDVALQAWKRGFSTIFNLGNNDKEEK